MKEITKNSRFDRSKLLIGTYYLMPYAQTEEHVKQLVAANIDFVIAEPRNDNLLNLLHKYNIGIFPKGILPQDEYRRTEDSLSIEKYEEAAHNYVDHPAIWGVFVGDEPAAGQFSTYGKLINSLPRLFPGLTPHLGLRGSCFQDFYTAGKDPRKIYEADSYQEYIDKFVENVNLDYIAYDNYVYIVPMATYLENFEIVANKCRETKRDFWFCGQVNNQDEKYIVSENMMRYQAYTALSYGAKVISWGCWTKGWWGNNVVDEYGNTTEQYAKLCKVNSELKKTGEIYMKYENKSTHYLGFYGTPFLSYKDKKTGKLISLKSENNIQLGAFNNLKIEGGSAIVGYFENDNSQAIMIADHSDPRDLGTVVAEISFTTDKKVSAIYNGEPVQIENKDGKYSVSISHCCGVFITLC